MQKHDAKCHCSN